MTHLPIASASTDVVATTSLVLALMNVYRPRRDLRQEGAHRLRTASLQACDTFRHGELGARAAQQSTSSDLSAKQIYIRNT